MSPQNMAKVAKFRQIWSKVDSHLLQWSTFSEVNCVNTELGNFLSLCRNTTVHCRIRTFMNEP